LSGSGLRILRISHLASRSFLNFFSQLNQHSLSRSAVSVDAHYRELEFLRKGFLSENYDKLTGRLDIQQSE
ncbi:hypothetical protein L9G16_16625, partial [Shewanella sp. A25]|nr:hypothetical protein [Shewanella shenzhenensis]